MKHPARFVWASSQKDLKSRKKIGRRPEKETLSRSLEAFLTRCSYEADWKHVFGRDLIRAHERTVGVVRGLGLFTRHVVLVVFKALGFEVA
jgi:hypothetical protein